MEKYNRFMLMTFIVLTLIISLTNVSASLPLSGKVIIVDSGHGGIDPGTLHDNIYEKDINLAVSLYLEKELSILGASVILTRSGDYDLSSPNTTWRKRSDFDNRINLINNSNADLYLSIHMNYLNDSSYSGAQVFYTSENENLANIVQSYMNKKLDSDRITKIMPNTYMYEKINIPGILIECGFLSNEKERELLITKEYQKKLANIIANSLIKYF